MHSFYSDVVRLQCSFFSESFVSGSKGKVFTLQLKHGRGPGAPRDRDRLSKKQQKKDARKAEKAETVAQPQQQHLFNTEDLFAANYGDVTVELNHNPTGQQDSLLTVWLRRVQGVLHDNQTELCLMRRIKAAIIRGSSFDADCTIIGIHPSSNNLPAPHDSERISNQGSAAAPEVSILKTRIQPNDEAQQEVQTRSIPDPREVAGCLLHMLLQQSRPMLCLILLSTVYQLVTQYGRIPVYHTFCGGFWNYFSLDLQKIKLRKCLASESMEGE
ncbi:hypothetical protein Zm00014a_034990 [Zea mays]|uniref:Uncharacterized protein n=1 Tax=Zea mays TaxID=4577 RepID=A0A3L6DRB3_MAIZE|nr:hypothetical protein Zm00014a_034990 [Zea mays]